ncbi:MAG: YHS domain-containing protein [Patescibacteria group bacterium]|jgi:YHS domain-containing protein
MNENYTHDPICKMYILKEKAAQTLNYENIDYWFCSEECKKIFEAEPDRYKKNTTNY